MSQRAKILPQADQQTSIAMLIFLELLGRGRPDHRFRYECRWKSGWLVLDILADDCFGDGNPKSHVVWMIVLDLLCLRICELGALGLDGAYSLYLLVQLSRQRQ